MEEQLGCQFRGIYAELEFGTEDTQKIADGQYPLILAKDGVFTKIYVSDSDLDNYGIFDALDTDVDAQHELHGFNVPIVWVKNEAGSMTETGIEHKICEPTED
jgi:hypothetical protein